jgi:hypothetical protein
MLGPEYTERDISVEQWREIITDGNVYRIDNPMKLITRAGGSTHRVVDDKGITHCYPAPETGKSIIRWLAKDSDKPVAF